MKPMHRCTKSLVVIYFSCHHLSSISIILREFSFVNLYFYLLFTVPNCYLSLDTRTNNLLLFNNYYNLQC